MTQDTFPIKHGDSEPPLDLLLRDTAGAAYNLTAVTALSCHIRRAGSTETVLTLDGAVLGLPTAGTARFAWNAGDTETLGVGDFEAEVHAERTDSGPVTWPSAGYIPITVWQEIEGLGS